MRKSPLAMYLLGLFLLFGVLYLGLNTVEHGMREMMSLDEPARSFVLLSENGNLIVTFGARDYVIPYAAYVDKLYSAFGSLKSWLVTR